LALLGDIFLNVVYKESPERGVETTDHPVEDGEPIVDHIKRVPKLLPITGIVTGSDAGAVLAELEKYMNEGTILSYSHRNGIDNVIIEKFDSNHDVETAGAFTFTIRLKQIRIAVSQGVEGLSLPAKVQVRGISNKGLQQGKTPAQMAAANGNHVKK
jgi:hypothetical protein